MGAGCLTVEFGEGEGPGVGEEGVEVVDGVEDGYDVEEGCGEADGVLIRMVRKGVM